MRRRRARRRVLQAGCAALVLLAAGAGVLAANAGDDDAVPVATTAAPVPPPATTVAPAELVEVHLETDRVRGNVRATLRFDRPLPGDEARRIDAWSDVTGERIEYLVQPMSETETCGSTHWFPNTTQMSLDVLVPETWLVVPDGDEPPDDTQEGAVEKYVICPPRQGIVQLAFWGMGPEPGHQEVRVTVTDGGRTLVIENP